MSDRYDSLFRHYGGKSNVQWQLLKAQVRAESNFNPNAVSPAGAKGLAQFMAPTWTEWGNGNSPYNPEASIEAQAKYMRWLFDQFPNQERQVLAAYNFGIGNVKRLLKEKGWEWFGHLPKETQDYVPRILGFRDEYLRSAG